MKTQTFRDLVVWQKAYDLTIKIYKRTVKYPKSEQFGITSQIRRASVSICSNIAEGFGRRSIKEKDQIYSVAHGSLIEVENQLLICYGVGYLEKSDLTIFMELCIEVNKILTRLQTVNKQKGAN